MNTMPGPALPVSVVTSGPVVGGVAIPVWGYSVAPTDGRAVLGGPATRVQVLSASDLVANGGTFYLAGTPLALPVVTASASTPVAGGPVIAVYPVNAGWPVAPVLPQVASATLLLDLRASQLALSDGDPVSTWADASGNGNDFTQSGSARPTYNVVGGIPQVTPDAVNDWMLGPAFADNLDEFAVFIVSNQLSNPPGDTTTGIQVMKMNGTANPPGWFAGAGFIYLETGVVDYVGRYVNNGIVDAFAVVSYIETPRGTLHVFVNGVEDSAEDDFGTFTTFASSEPLSLFTNGLTLFNFAPVRAILIYQITDATAFMQTDRPTIEAWLATNP